MFNTGIYVVLERAMMDDILKEQGFQQTGCVTSGCAVEVGNMLGVQQMVGGSIGKLGNMYTVSARIIDVETGTVLKSANYDHIGGIEQLGMMGMNQVALKLLGIQIDVNSQSTSKMAPITSYKDNKNQTKQIPSSKNTTVLKQYNNQKSHNYGLFIGGIATENRVAINSNIRIYKNLGMGIIISGNNMTSGHSVTNYLPYISIEPKNYSEIWSSSFLLGLTYTQIDLQSKGIDFLYDNSSFIAYSLNLRIGLIGMSFLAGVIENIYINDNIDGTSEISDTSYEFFPGLSFNIYLY
jgi:hypothetical protein